MYRGKEVTEDGGRWAPSLYHTSYLTRFHAEEKQYLSPQDGFDHASFDFRLLSTTAAVGGEVLPPHISIPYSNYTYSMAIYLPRIRCQPSDPSLFPLNQSSLFPWLGDFDYFQGPQDTEFAFDMRNFAYSSIPLDSPTNFTGRFAYLSLAELTPLGQDRRPSSDVRYDQTLSYDQSLVENPIYVRRTGRLDIATNEHREPSISTFECHVYNSSFEIVNQI